MEGCPGCSPEGFFTDRRSEGHVSVRFGDQKAGRRWTIKVDGVNVTKQCFEADAEEGYVVLYRTNNEGKRYRCPDTNHAAMKILRGRVTVWKENW